MNRTPGNRAKPHVLHVARGLLFGTDMRNALVVLALLISTTVASAQPSLAPIADPEEPAHPMAAPKPDVTNPDLGAALAVGTTLGGVAIIAATVKYNLGATGWIGVTGLLVGPSAGHLYAGEWAHALGMSALRTAGALVLTIGLVNATTTYSDGPQPDHRNATSMMLVGGAAYVIGTLYDIYDARSAVRRANAGSTRTIVPTVGTQGGYGLAVAGRF